MKKLASVIAVLLIVSIASVKTYAQVSIGISINIAPPALPTYSQPPCPVDGYLWTPGYWAYDQDGGYYWVPGVWVSPPQPGYLWTPGYWGYSGSVYVYHEGYWGRHVGFYGGVNYGYGYGGSGYGGGRWSGNTFQYNTAVVNVNKTVVHNTYINKTVINNVTVNRSSYNGPGGITAKPRPQELAAEKEQHVQPTSEQLTHRQTAVKDKSQFAKVNNGHPATAAMNKVNGTHYSPAGHRASPGATPVHENSEKQKSNPANPVNHENKPAAPARHIVNPGAQQHAPRTSNHVHPVNNPTPHNRSDVKPAPQHAPAQQHMQQPPRQRPSQPMPQHENKPEERHR